VLEKGARLWILGEKLGSAWGKLGKTVENQGGFLGVADEYN